MSLQILNIPNGWTVALDDLSGDDAIYLNEDLLQLKHRASNRLVDVGWYGEESDGSFKLVVYEGDFRGRLLLEQHTQDRDQLVDMIERAMQVVSSGVL